MLIRVHGDTPGVDDDRGGQAIWRRSGDNQALADTGVGIVIGAANGDIPSLASDPGTAARWVGSNILPFCPASNINLVTGASDVGDGGGDGGDRGRRQGRRETGKPVGWLPRSGTPWARAGATWTGCGVATVPPPSRRGGLPLWPDSVGQEDEQKPTARYMNISDGHGSLEATDLARPRQQPSELPSRFESAETERLRKTNNIVRLGIECGVSEIE
ncbi:hypothetical protein NL676_022712 [Syzygium grande]|nr:hypothetical protein NL676_022712 [Syzygium grande]